MTNFNEIKLGDKVEYKDYFGDVVTGYVSNVVSGYAFAVNDYPAKVYFFNMDGTQNDMTDQGCAQALTIA
jgi:hypothetical protein